MGAPCRGLVANGVVRLVVLSVPRRHISFGPSTVQASDGASCERVPNGVEFTHRVRVVVLCACVFAAEALRHRDGPERPRRFSLNCWAFIPAAHSRPQHHRGPAAPRIRTRLTPFLWLCLLSTPSKIKPLKRHSAKQLSIGRQPRPSPLGRLRCHHLTNSYSLTPRQAELGPISASDRLRRLPCSVPDGLKHLR